MSRFVDICRVATSTTGTGDATLGTTVPGFLSFSDAGLVNGDKVTYGITDGVNREIGHGSYDATNGKLLRTTVLHSTNANAKISLSGNAQIYLTISQADIVALSAGAVTACSGTASVGSAATVAVTLAVDIDDASGWSSGNATRITIPAGQTRVRVMATGSASATCGVSIYKNGSLLKADTGPVSASGNHLFAQVLTNWITVTPGDYFEVYASNPNNTTISVSASLMVEYSPTGVLQGSGGGGSGDGIVPVSNSITTPTSGKAQLYALAPLVPRMTGATTPSGTASASDYYSGDSYHQAWAAFCGFPYGTTGANGGGWLTNGNSTGWLQYQFPSACIVRAYAFSGWSADTWNGRVPTAWTLQGSNNGSTWTTLDTRTCSADAFVRYVKRVFIVASPNSYAYYRLNITANNGNSYMGVQQLQLYGDGTPVASEDSALVMVDQNGLMTPVNHYMGAGGAN